MSTQHSLSSSVTGAKCGATSLQVPVGTRRGIGIPHGITGGTGHLLGMLLSQISSARPGQSCWCCCPELWLHKRSVMLHWPQHDVLLAVPNSPAARGAHKDGTGNIFIAPDTGYPRLSCFTWRAKEASLCYAAAGLAAQPSEGKEERSSGVRV